MTPAQYISLHFFRNPARIAITCFSLLVCVGMLLLILPWATVTGNIPPVDAFFTAVSACSVTGLGVVDTGSYFTLAGQIIVLLLVQVGGLGVMTFSTLFILMAGRRPGIITGQTLKDTYTQSGEHHPLEILKDVLLFTLVIESIGALLLFTRFSHQFPLPKALFLSVFHAVCAFCNAGFSLFPDSLMRYRSDWLVSSTVAALVILGGLGFLVFSDIRRGIQSPNRFWKEISLHTKVVIVVSIVLLAAGTTALFLLEQNRALAGLTLPDKLLVSFFQSVTARTAGFNTIDIKLLSGESLLLIMVLMFIGAGAGSAAGGIKVSTAGILAVLGWSHLRGEERPQIFFRSISKSSTDRAVSAVILSVLIVIVILLLLQVLEGTNPLHPLGHERFLYLSFETVSAFGTVGLSTGITEHLTSAGKLLLAALMTIGKLGMLTLALAVTARRTHKFRYAEENIMVG